MYQSTDQTEQDQRIPVPRHGATYRRDHVQHGHHAQAVATAVSFTGKPGQHRTQNRAPQRAGHGHAQQARRELVRLGKRGCGSRNHYGVESKQEPAQGRDNRALDQRSVEAHFSSRTSIGRCNCRTSSRDHFGIAPGRLATSAPTRFAKSAISEAGHPAPKPCTKAAANASPAPTVSTTLTAYPLAVTYRSPISHTQP